MSEAGVKRKREEDQSEEEDHFAPQTSDPPTEAVTAQDEDGFIPFSLPVADIKNDQQYKIFDANRKRRPSLLNRVIIPWMKLPPRLDNRPPPLVRFHNEILRFCDFIAPTKEEMTFRDQTLAEVSNVITSLWPTAEVKIFGSQLTNVITPSSDLDIAILNVPIPEDEDAVDLMATLTQRLRDRLPLSYLELISHARVPIIKLDHARTGISVDICINNDQGIRTGELVKQFMTEFPALKPLMLVLKMFLAQRKLNETYTGGIGSFLLCATIVSFLQMKEKLAKYTDTRMTHNLGCLLLEYLHHYGVNFNYFMAAISLMEGGRFFPKAVWEDLAQTVAATNSSTNNTTVTNTNNNQKPGVLCLQNPDVLDHDVGRGAYMIPKIRRVFEQALQLLTAALNDHQEFSYLCYMIRGDDPLLVQRLPPGYAATQNSTNSNSNSNNYSNNYSGINNSNQSHHNNNDKNSRHDHSNNHDVSITRNGATRIVFGSK